MKPSMSRSEAAQRTLSLQKIAAAFVAIVALASTMFTPRLAHAQQVLATRPERFDSPQHFALELRFSPYSPRVDEDPALGGKNPYDRAFGDGDRVLVGVEFDWQALRIPHFGSIGPGISASYTSISGNARIRSTGQESKEYTSLQIYPLYGLAVLRIDVLARDLRIPFVPYGKAGVGWAGWRVSGPKGTARTETAVGKGQTWGTHFAAGLALQLDVFERNAARALDEASGINHTYLFGEYYWSMLDGFGSNTALRVGDKAFSFGLAFEF